MYKLKPKAIYYRTKILYIILVVNKNICVVNV